MRKIVSREKEEKRRKRNQIIIGIILIFVMFSSILGYALQSFLYSGGNVGERTENDIQNSIIYNGFSFTEQNNFWITTIEGSSFIFRNNPEETENIVTGEINKKLSDFENKKLYIYSENAKAESEVYTNLLQSVDGIENACPSDENCAEGLPKKSCEDNFIIIKSNDNDELSEKGRCIFIESNEPVRATDEFLFKVLGIK